MYLLVAEEDGKAVSSVQMAIIESLTHNVRPFAVIENAIKFFLRQVQTEKVP